MLTFHVKHRVINTPNSRVCLLSIESGAKKEGRGGASNGMSISFGFSDSALVFHVKPLVEGNGNWMA